MVKIKHNVDEHVRKMAKRARAAGDLIHPHAQISAMLDRWVQKNIEGEGKHVGGWKPFAVYTVGGPRSPYGIPRQSGRGRVIGKGPDRHIDESAKLLRDSGRLRKSLRPFHNQKNAGVEGPKDSSMEYVGAHHRGDGHLPERRLLPRIGEVRKDVIRVYEQWLRRRVTHAR